MQILAIVVSNPFILDFSDKSEQKLELKYIKKIQNIFKDINIEVKASFPAINDQDMQLYFNIFIDDTFNITEDILKQIRELYFIDSVYLKSDVTCSS